MPFCSRAFPGWAAGLVLLLAIHPAFAQNKHCLWKIQTKTNTVYLLGSLHALKPEQYPLSAALENAYASSQRLVTEVNIDSMLQPNVINSMTKKALYTDGTTLQQNISEKTYLLTRKKVTEFGLDIKRLQPYQPWFVALSVLGLKLQQLGFDPDAGIDRHFYMKARKEKKGLDALESVDFQINLLTSLTAEHQEMLLLQTIRDLEMIEDSFDEMYTAWTDGDITKLDGLLRESFEDYPAVYSKLIIERNRNWIPQIERFLHEKENYLVVVGAGHLIGKDSVIEMLRSKGYRAEQQ